MATSSPRMSPLAPRGEAWPCCCAVPFSCCHCINLQTALAVGRACNSPSSNCRAKQAAEKQAEKDDAAFTAATSQPAVGAPAGAAAVAAAASPSQPDEGPDTDSREPSATVKAPATATLRQPDASSSPAASDRAHREPSGQAPPSDKAPDDSVGGTEAAMGAPAAPKPAVPVRHTDDSAKAAARERYLARKKRKAEEAPEPLPS